MKCIQTHVQALDYGAHGCRIILNLLILLQSEKETHLRAKNQSNAHVEYNNRKNSAKTEIPCKYIDNILMKARRTESKAE